MGRGRLVGALLASSLVAATVVLAGPASATIDPGGYAPGDPATWPWLEGGSGAGSRTVATTGWGAGSGSGYAGAWYGRNDAPFVDAQVAAIDATCEGAPPLDVDLAASLPGTDVRPRIALIGDGSAAQLLRPTEASGPLASDPIYRWLEADRCGQRLFTTTPGAPGTAVLPPELVDALRDPAVRSTRSVVVSLGAADVAEHGPIEAFATAAASAVGQVYDEVTGSEHGAAIPCVTWVSVPLHPSDGARRAAAERFNDELYALRADHPWTVQVVDWAGAVRLHPEYLAADPDGSATRLTSAGVSAQADLIRLAVQGCAAAHPSSGSFPAAPSDVRIQMDEPTTGSAHVSWTAADGPAPAGYRVRTYGMTGPGASPTSFGVTRFVTGTSVTVPAADLTGMWQVRATVEAVNALGTSSAVESTLDVDPAALTWDPVALLPGSTVLSRGRDGGDSVELSDGRSLWLFGDSVTGLHNSAALSQSASAPLVLVDPPTPHPFIAPLPVADPASACSDAHDHDGLAATTNWIWPLGAVRLPATSSPAGRDRVLVYFLNRCVRGESVIEGPGWVGVGSYDYTPGLADPILGPDGFHLTTIRERVFPTKQAVVPISGTVHDEVPLAGLEGLDVARSSDGSSVDLVLCQAAPSTRKASADYLGCRLARVAATAEAAGDPGAYSWRDDVAQTWVPDLAGSTPLRFPGSWADDGPASIVSLRWMPGLDRYVLAATPWPGTGDQVLVRTAMQPEGPWSEPMRLSLGTCDGCYGVRLLPQVSGPGQLVLSISDPASSAATSTVRTFTFSGPPGVPAAPTAVEGDRRATVSWPTPATGASPTTGYAVTALDRTGTAVATVAVDAPSTSATITGLVNGESYRFTVTATNSVGTSGASPPSGIVIPPHAPSGGTTAIARFVAAVKRSYPGPGWSATPLSSSAADLAAGRRSTVEVVEQARDRTDGVALTRWAPLFQLYRAVFLRDPDPSGWKHWDDRYEGLVRPSSNLTQIAAAMVTSSEFTRRYGRLSDAAYLDRIYRNVLGRGPDAGGTAYWLPRLRSGKVTRVGLVVQFAVGSEFARKNAARVQAFTLSYGMTNRVVPSTAEVGRLAALATTVGAYDAAKRSAITRAVMATSRYVSRFA